MKRRTFTTAAGDVIEVRTRKVTDGQTNVVVVMQVESEIGTSVLELRPKEFTRFADRWMHDVDGAIWAAEMGECDEHDLTLVRCQKCGRYCGTKKRCPHCAPRSK
jgi:hypothetical protein